jgi:hypothetical protein
MAHPFTYRQFLIYGLLALGVSVLLKACDHSISPPAVSTVERSSNAIPNDNKVK